MNDLIQRLREHQISAPPEHPVHPSICDEAASEIKYLRREKDARIYYQKIVYAVCDAMDVIEKRNVAAGGIVCGSLERPSTEVQEAMVRLMVRLSARLSVRLSARLSNHHSVKGNPMKFKQYLQLIADHHGFIPTPRLQWVIRKNPRPTAREEAIAASVLEQANPRENITGHFPWNKEEQMVLQQLWIQPDHGTACWRDVAIKDAEDLFSVVSTKHGDMPVPNAVKEPGVVQGDFQERIREAMGGEED